MVTGQFLIKTCLEGKQIAWLCPEGCMLYVVSRRNLTSALIIKARDLFFFLHGLFIYPDWVYLKSIPQAPLHLCDEEHKCHEKAKCHLGKCYCQGNSTGNGIFCRGKLLNNGQRRRDEVENHIQCSDVNNREFKLPRRQGRGQRLLKKMNSYFIHESRDTIKPFTLFITVKTITKLNQGHSDKIEIAILKN